MIETILLIALSLSLIGNVILGIFCMRAKKTTTAGKNKEIRTILNTLELEVKKLKDKYIS